MVTTFATIALSVLLTSTSIPSPAWQNDYNRAKETAVEQQKPMAVFIGKGVTGFRQLVGGEVPVAAGELLSKCFVCVYVDTDTTAGQSLANQFELSNGFVISGKSGETQAFRYVGTVAPSELTGYLTRFSDTSSPVTTTVKAGDMTAATMVPSMSFSSSCASGRCGMVMQTGYTTSASAYAGYSPTSSYAPSSCSSGSCGATSSCSSGTCGSTSHMRGRRR